MRPCLYSYLKLKLKLMLMLKVDLCLSRYLLVRSRCPMEGIIYRHLGQVGQLQI
jgi:hypothetical protein